MLETRSGAQRAPRTSLEWCAYYAANAVAANVPWTAPVRLTDDERRAIAASVQQFQLGESSEGRHLHAAARVYATRTGDEAYVSAIEAFIREEQRHARDLGRFLTAEGIPLTKESRPDAVFRWLRRGAGVEVTVSVLLTAEIIAQVYYAALRDATRSPILRALCDRILADEAAHVRFQAERLGMLRAGRGRVGVTLAVAAQRTLFAATALIVWNGHRPALERGGFFFSRYWSECWERFRDAAEMMRPLNAGTDDGGRGTDVRRPAAGGRKKGVSSRAARRAVIPSRQARDRGPPGRGPSPRSRR